MNPPFPAITVSVVSHGQGELAQRFLDDLARVARPELRHLIVTSNLPEAWQPKFDVEGVVVEHLTNAVPLGFGANHNQAFEHCRTPLFLIANPDIRMPSDPFDALQVALEPASIGLVTPSIRSVDGHVEDFARRLLSLPNLVSRTLGDRRPVADPDWVAGMFMLVRSAAFTAVGGFDRRFRLYCEDFDLCARLRLAGFDFIVVDAASVVHEARRDSHRSMRHLAWHLQSLLKVWLSATFWRYRSLLRRGTSSMERR
ncbi:glycosyltransferase family 2 protein [soil metagenome]